MFGRFVTIAAILPAIARVRRPSTAASVKPIGPGLHLWVDVCKILFDLLATVLAAAGTAIVLHPRGRPGPDAVDLGRGHRPGGPPNPSMREAAAGVSEAEATSGPGPCGLAPARGSRRGVAARRPAGVRVRLAAVPAPLRSRELRHRRPQPSRDPLSNFHTAITAEQLVFDGGRRESGVRQAKLGAQIANVASQDAVRALRTGGHPELRPGPDGGRSAQGGRRRPAVRR